MFSIPTSETKQADSRKSRVRASEHYLAHLAARMEYEKLERNLPESEIAGWK